MRKGQSMFAPYRKKIEKWCAQGLTLPQMMKKLPSNFRYEGLYNYIRINGIRDVNLMKVKKGANVCDKCDYCHKVRNVKGKYNKADNRLCTKSWRLIQYSVKLCPTWCERKNDDDNSETV